MPGSSHAPPIALHAQMLSEALQEGQQLVLEQMAAGDGLDAVLNTLCALVEMHAPGLLAAIVLYDENDDCLRFGAAPSLPPSYPVLVEGRPVGPGSCVTGAAILRRSNVVAEDVVRDPSFADAMKPYAALGLAAAAAVPILGPDKTVLGTFVIYKSEVGPFEPIHIELVQKITSVASVAIRNDRREKSLERSQAALREAQRIGRFGNWSLDVATGEMEWSDEVFRLYQRDPELGSPSLDAYLGYLALEDRATFRASLEERRRDKSRFEIDLRVVLPSGREAYHHVILSPSPATGAARATSARSRT